LLEQIFSKGHRYDQAGSLSVACSTRSVASWSLVSRKFAFDRPDATPHPGLPYDT